MVLNVNVDEVVIYARKLEIIHRSAFPVAVRTALNSAAFDVKTRTMLQSSDNEFVNRQKNFFKANSRVDQAKGFDIDSMKSTVGFIEGGLKGGSNFAVKDLVQQEHGGNIRGRNFVAMRGARVGNSDTKAVRPGNRLSGINKIVDARNSKGVNDKQKFVKSVMFAGTGGYVLANYKEKVILWRVNSLDKTESGSFKLTALYSYENNRSVSVTGTHFMEKASVKSSKRIEYFFIKEAQKQLAKYK